MRKLLICGYGKIYKIHCYVKKARHRAVWIVCHVLCKNGQKLRIYILANWYIHKKNAESIKQGSW